MGAINAWLQKFEWGDLNENGNFKDGKLVMHGYKRLHGLSLTNMAI